MKRALRWIGQLYPIRVVAYGVETTLRSLRDELLSLALTVGGLIAVIAIGSVVSQPEAFQSQLLSGLLELAGIAIVVVIAVPIFDIALAPARMDRDARARASELGTRIAELEAQPEQPVQVQLS